MQKSVLWVFIVLVTAILGAAPAVAYTTSFHASQEQALVTCQNQYSNISDNQCLTEGYKYYRWCNTGCVNYYASGLQSCTGIEQLWVTPGPSCTTYTTSYHYFVYPTSPLGPGMTLIGPTSTDTVPTTAIPPTQKHLGGCQDRADTANAPADGLYGNPCDAASGNKLEYADDFVGGGGSPAFSRTYNSQLMVNLGLGYGWTHSHATRLEHKSDDVIHLHLGSGRIVPFTKFLFFWYAHPDVRLSLTEGAETYTVAYPSGQREVFNKLGNMTARINALGQATTYTYNSSGLLTKITGPFGHALTLAYDGSTRLSTMTNPVGGITRYTYDARSNLIKVTYPGGDYRQYHYENPAFTHALTGITDEKLVRYATFGYDAQGRATSTEHAVTDNGIGQERFTFAYGAADVQSSFDEGETTTTVVTDAGGHAQTLTFTNQHGGKLLTSRVSNADGKQLVQSFNDENLLISRTDEEGRTTSYTYNGAGQLESVTEATGTAQARTTTIEYLSTTIDLPTRIESPSVATGLTEVLTVAYDVDNRPATVTESGYTPAGQAVSRTFGITYNTHGQVTVIDGPRADVSDITQFEYYECTTGVQCGQLYRITNAAGHVTTFNSYDAAGRLLSVTDPRGVVTTYTYSTRGWVTGVTETPPVGAARTTTYTYDKVGQLITATLPGGLALTFVYDAAHDLKSVTDSLGNQIVYAYDSRGNRTIEQVKDQSGTLARSVETVFDLRNQPATVTRPGSITNLVHDAVGNLTQITDPNGHPTSYQYDALDRLTRVVDALGGFTDLEHGPTDTLSSVTAPNGANTTYQVDDLGNRVTEASPDRGSVVQTFDPAGNILSRTDGRGVTATLTYDALNRVTSVTYPTAGEDVSYVYDACTNGSGRLCVVTDPMGTWSYTYDGFGRIVSASWATDGRTYTTSYSWTPGDILASVTYPSGRTITYTRDAIGRVTAVASNGASLLSNRTYRADGLVTGQTWGNGISEGRAYDLQGRMTTWQAGGLLNRAYTYDANGNVVQKDAAQFQYDALDRLIGEPAQTIIYDGNGNRLSDGAGLYSYTPASNRMITGPPGVVQLDVAGNTLAIDATTFTYNQAGRMSSAIAGGQNTTYTYGHDGLRTSKAVNGITTLYHYDIDGRLIAETDTGGSTLREYAWDDAVPIAQFTGGAVTYLHTDRLGTPRIGTDQAGMDVWRWEPDAFGTTAPTGTVTVNLRYPGQYFDAETGLHQNWHRTYAPSSGRYLESDPIGLGGGLNTFGYVTGNPLRYSDPRGLCVGPLAPVCYYAVVYAEPLLLTTIIGAELIGGVPNPATSVVSASRNVVGATCSLAKDVRAYSVAFEASIAKSGAGTRAAHFTEANRILAETIANDPDFAKSLMRLGVAIPQRLNQSPANWTWHHVPERSGILQLIPREQHQGRLWQPLLHPNQTGGFKLWGSDY